MFTSFSTALSGLNAMSTAIDVVGNNLANLNTTGYKDTTVSFAELISQSMGGSSNTQVGLGTSTPDATRQFAQGAIQTTSGQYDTAIEGAGFFVVKDQGDQTLYTRAGDFQVDQNGYLVTAGGERVQGWPAVNGVPSVNGLLGDIQVPVGGTSKPIPTTTFSIDANLNSSTSPLTPLSTTGSVHDPFTFTASNNTLNLMVNGQYKSFTLNTADASPFDVAADLTKQFAGLNVTASSSTGALVLTATPGTANTGLQVLPSGTANATLGLGSTVLPTSVSGVGSTLSDPVTITPGVNDSLNLNIDGTTYNNIPLSPNDGSLSDVVTDLNSTFANLKIGATASAVGGQLSIQSTGATTPSVEVLSSSNTGYQTLGLLPVAPPTSITGTAPTVPLAAAGNIDLRIDGKLVSVPVALGDTINAVATKINTAIGTAFGAKADATASVVNGNLTIQSTAAGSAGSIQVMPTSAPATLTALGFPVPAFNPLVTGAGVAIANRFAITTGTNDVLNFSINGQNITATLNPADTSINDVIADLNRNALVGKGATASKDPVTGNLTITSTAIGANAYVQVLAGTANATLGMPVATPPLTATGTADESFAINASNDTLNLMVNGQAVSIPLTDGDSSMTQVIQDVTNRFKVLGMAATASRDPVSGGLIINSTSSNANAGVQVLAASANTTLGLAQTPTDITTANTFSTSTLQAVDSLGNQVPITLTFTKETTNGTWNYSASTAQGVAATGTAQFDQNGNLVSLGGPNVTPDGRNVTLAITNSADGAAPLSLTWSFFNADGTSRLTQVAEASGASTPTQDGKIAAGFTQVSLGNGGQVLATYTDGSQQVVGQLALANFRNPQSLLGVPDNNYSIGADTSAANVGTSGTGGRGTIEGGSLESSTVDIASEFSNLLIYQRSYQANSRVITVSDELTQETVNLIK